MLQCESAMATASLRLRLLYRMLRAGELLALVALVSWSSSHVPSAVAAALRLAGSLLLNARFVFILGNAIVLLLFALSRHDLSPSSSSSNDDEQQQPAASTTATAAPAPLQASFPPAAAAAASASASASFPSFTALTALPSISMGGGAAASFATPVDPLPPATDEAREATIVPAPDPVPRASSTVLFENNRQPSAAVRVTKARAPRRSRSEKMGRPARRAASPELRRCESENNGRRRRSSVTARDAEVACWGREDADEFRRQVEAFIARQTRFHREESLTMAAGHHCEAAPAFTGALAVVE